MISSRTTGAQKLSLSCLEGGLRFDMALKVSEYAKAMIALHITVLLWGVTAILGKLISYSSFMLVWHRMFITFIVYCLIYILIPSVRKEFQDVSWKHYGIFFCIGLLVASHWLLFYGSIKLGDSASVTLACMGSTSFFSSIMEPLALKSPFSFRDSFLGLVVLSGVLFIYFSLPKSAGEGVSYKLAIITGLLAAFVGSVFTIMNKKYISFGSSLVISTVEMGAGALVLTVVTPLYYGAETKWYPNIDVYNLTQKTVRTGEWDLIWVLILSILCTNITFFLSTNTLHHLSAFTVNLTVNLEPVYGIILGALIFKENQDLNSEFYIGTVVILVAIFASPIIGMFDRSENVSTEDKSSLELGNISYEPVSKVDLDENTSSTGEI